MYWLNVSICNHYLLFVRHSVLYIRFWKINILYLDNDNKITVHCLESIFRSNVHFWKKSPNSAHMSSHMYLSNPIIGHTFWRRLTPSNFTNSKWPPPVKGITQNCHISANNRSIYIFLVCFLTFSGLSDRLSSCWASSEKKFFRKTTKLYYFKLKFKKLPVMINDCHYYCLL